ncbi:MAG TPA: hypothetical protein VK559_02895 [Ferruginibacter sp.]|nr:hypothetical protein [Ferruginibacter sp.]
MKARQSLLIIFSSLLILLSACKKDTSNTNNGGNNNNNTNSSGCLIRLTATTSAASVVKGGSFTISADSSGENYEWEGPDYFQSYYRNNTISEADYSNAGWYYVNASSNGCNSVFDSVYVNVTIPQGSPSCSLTNNYVSFTGVANDQSFTSGLSYNTTEGYTLQGGSANGDITIILSTHWYSIEPEDGVYTTISDQTFGDGEIDNIFISDVNSDILFTAAPGASVYVSHVAGKIQISFCSLNMSGNDGVTEYYTVASGRATLN